MSGSIKGALKSGTARPTIGVYFMDATGKWLGLQALSRTIRSPATGKNSTAR